MSRDSEKNNKQNGTVYYACLFIVIPTRNRNLSRDRFEIRMGRVIKRAFISQDLCESGSSSDNGNDALVSWSYNDDGNDGTTLASS